MQPMRIIVSRRSAILVLTGAATNLSHSQNGKPRTTIHQEIDFKVGPDRLYEALLDAKRFSSFTGDSAEIQRLPGGNFKLFGGRIEGRNIELVSNQRIVQAWREASWSPGIYSLVKFELVARNFGTRVVFDQTGIAEQDWEHLNEGWPIRYWQPLHKHLGV
jgi:activator of HSP90 ATPase